MSEETQDYKSPISTENGRNYNKLWNQEGGIAVGFADIPYDIWPFKHKEETEEEYNQRMNKIKEQNKNKQL